MISRVELTMRFLILGCAALALSAAPALAMENFIPLGQNYAPGDDTLPPIGSEQDQMNAQIDIYQTDAYYRALREKQVESRFRQMRDQGMGSTDDSQLDY
jgi:hypothetical protein